jgi:hypothetical protein
MGGECLPSVIVSIPVAALQFVGYGFSYADAPYSSPGVPGVIDEGRLLRASTSTAACLS